MTGIRELIERGVRMLIVTSEWDPSHDYFKGPLRHRLRQAGLWQQLSLATVEGADHDFNLMAHQRRLAETVADWCDRLARAQAGDRLGGKDPGPTIVASAE